MQILAPSPGWGSVQRAHPRLQAQAPQAPQALPQRLPWLAAIPVARAFRRSALRASGMGDATLMKKDRKKVKEMETGMLEGALKTLFQRMDEPDIFKVREILMRLAKTNKKPNQNLAGDWIIFWASREGCQKPSLFITNDIYVCIYAYTYTS